MHHVYFEPSGCDGILAASVFACYAHGCHARPYVEGEIPVPLEGKDVVSFVACVPTSDVMTILRATCSQVAIFDSFVGKSVSFREYLRKEGLGFVENGNGKFVVRHGRVLCLGDELCTAAQIVTWFVGPPISGHLWAEVLAVAKYRPEVIMEYMPELRDTLEMGKCVRNFLRVLSQKTIIIGD